MKITKLSIHGLKSRDQEIRPAKLNLITGPVGSGKSTVLDALAFAALGWIPRLGKGIAETARLMREDTIAVQVATDVLSFARTLRRDGSALRRVPVCSTVDTHEKDAAHSEAIVSLFGNGEAEAAENIDLRALLSCTPNERASKLEKLVASGAMTLDQIAERVYTLAVARMADVTPDRIPAGPAGQSVIAGLLGTLPVGVQATMARVRGDLGRAIPDLIEYAASSATEARATTKTTRAAHAEITLRQSTMPTATVDVAAISAQRDEAIGSMSSLSDRYRAAIAARQAVNAARESERQFAGAVDAAQATLNAAREAIPNADALEAQLRGITDPEDVVAPAPVAPDPSAEESVAILTRGIEALVDPPEVPRFTPEIVPLPIDCYRETVAVDGARFHVERLRASPWRKVEEHTRALARFFDRDGPDAPVDEGMQRLDALLTLAAENGGSLASMENVLAVAVADLAKATAAKEARDAEIAQVAARNLAAVEANDAERKQYTNDLAYVRRQRDDLRTLIQNTRSAAAKEAEAANREAHAEYMTRKAARDAVVRSNADTRESMRSQSANIRRTAADAQAQFDRASSALREIRARLAGMNPQDAEAIGVALNAARDERDRLTAQLDECQRYDALRSELARLVDRIQEADDAVKVWTSIVDAAKQTRAEDLSARSAGLVGRIGTFLKAAGRSEQPYIRTAKGVCDFGWNRHGKDISVEALSGGESVLFCAAMAAAVIAMRAPQIKVLLLEAAELGSAESADAVLAGCAGIADAFDHVFVATCADVDAPAGWNVIAHASTIGVAS